MRIPRNGYTLCPIGPAPARPDTAGEGWVLSRFAVLRRDGDDLLLESPLSWCTVRVHDPALVAEIVRGASEELGADLRWAGLTVPPGSEEDFRTRQWAPHELWFHHRSRHGGPGEGFGGTGWAQGRFDPLPARPPRYAGTTVPLPRPDLASLRRDDPPLTAVVEDRRSIRDFDDDHPITLDRLGEFLFRTCRVRAVMELDGVEYVSRPYPAGGGGHELEVYPLVRLADGVRPALYHYDSHDHRLVEVRAIADPAVQRLLRAAMGSAGLAGPPQVMVLAAARIGRVMWKYEQMAYALVLNHVGVLYQAMYCAATAMGLGGCALGVGDPDALAEATGRDPLTECGVGEFLLGQPRRRR